MYYFHSVIWIWPCFWDIFRNFRQSYHRLKDANPFLSLRIDGFFFGLFYQVPANGLRCKTFTLSKSCRRRCPSPNLTSKSLSEGKKSEMFLFSNGFSHRNKRFENEFCFTSDFKELLCDLDVHENS